MNIFIPPFVLVSLVGVLVSLGSLLVAALVVFVGYRLTHRGNQPIMAAGLFGASPFISWRGPVVMCVILLIAALTGSFLFTALVGSAVTVILAATILRTM